MRARVTVPCPGKPALVQPSVCRSWTGLCGTPVVSPYATLVAGSGPAWVDTLASSQEAVVQQRPQLIRRHRATDELPQQDPEDSKPPAQTGGRGPGARTHGPRADGVPAAGPAGVPYLSSRSSRLCRLRATSAQASTAPCRVCRSGLCAMDSRQGRTAKTGRTQRLSACRGACRLGSEPKGRHAPLKVVGHHHDAGPQHEVTARPDSWAPGSGWQRTEDAARSSNSLCAPGPQTQSLRHREGTQTAHVVPANTRPAAPLPGDRAGQA